MAIIKVDDDLNLTEEVADFMLFLIKENATVARRLSIPEIMLTKIRPGMNSEMLTASIISRFNEAGIPSGPLAEGTPNVMEAFVKIFVEELIDSIHEDMRIDVVIDPGAVLSAIGANAGGPVTAVGATTAPHTGVGVAN